MKEINCKNCGASSLIEKNGYWLCEYCGSKFSIESSDLPHQGMGLSISTDIEKLLYKCRTDPKNAKKYANLILYIDPANEEAFKYII